MNRRLVLVAAVCVLAATAVGVVIAQRMRDRDDFQRRFATPEELRLLERGGAAEWHVDEEFKHDVFTFVRVEYDSYRDSWRRPKWKTDYPDSDLNFSYRLQELTSLEVDPNGKILRLTDDELFDYPFLYLIEPGQMILSDAEVKSLRRYLLSGGFLMVDDFWGPLEWDNFYGEIKRVFPDREPVELPLEHEIFHNVYDLKQKPQVPSIHGGWYYGRTYERDFGDPDPHYKGLFDDEGRMMAIICHNTDLGDGWEREGEDPEYFSRFSEKWSYPLGINIVTYAMTH